MERTLDVLHLPKRLWLGRRGESGFRPVKIRWDEWHRDYPDATLSVIYHRPDGDDLIVATSTNSPLIWFPQLDTTTVSGYGELEMHLVGDPEIGISASVDTIVDDSRSNAKVDSRPAWADEVVQKVAEVQTHYPTIIDSTWHVWDVDDGVWADTGVSARGVDGADGHSPYIALNGHWMVYSDSTGEWIDTGVAARGADGVSPTVTITEITRGHRVKITDAEHPNGQSFDVTNGFNGLNGTNGADGHSPYADATTGTWWVYDDATGLWVDSHVTAAGTNGKSPYINSSGYWVFWNDSTGAWVVTNYKAAGVDGEDGHSPYIGANGHWFAWDANLAAYDDTGVAAQGPHGDDYVLTNQDKADIAAMALPSDTASGAIASFPDGADDAAVKSLVAQIAPVQSGSGDPSPTNIRPISGWTSATVTRAGKNLLPNKTCQWPENKLIIGDDKIREGIFLKQGTYTVSARRSKGKIFCKTPSGSNITLTPNTSTLSGTLTVAKDDYYRFWIYDSSGFTASDVEWFQLELGSTATDYEPYQSDTYDITFPSEAGTVYGGTLDVTNGVLTVTKGLIPSYSGEALPGEWISSMDVYAQGVTPTTGAQVCYDLASPITYQLTPTEVKTLLGVNNIWADTGDAAVDYRADTGLYIQKLTGSTEEDMIADAPIASGKYFFVGNTLYLSTAAIAAGATLTPGTNCVKTNLAEALNALNS